MPENTFKINIKINKSGFSLVEIMIVVGIVAIIGLGVASMMTNMNKSQRGISDASEIQNTVNELQMLLTNVSKSCSKSLDPIPTNNFVGTNKVSLNKIFWPAVAADGTVTDAGAIVEAGKDLKNAKGLKVVSVDLKDGQKLNTTSSRMDTNDGSTHTYSIYTAQLVMEFKREDINSVLGPNVRVREMPITLLFDEVTNKFFDCYLQDSHDSQCSDYFGGDYTGTQPPKCHIPLAVSSTDYKINTGGNVGGNGITNFEITADGNIKIGGKTQPQVFVSKDGNVGFNTNNTGFDTINVRAADNNQHTNILLEPSAGLRAGVHYGVIGSPGYWMGRTEDGNFRLNADLPLGTAVKTLILGNNDGKIMIGGNGTTPPTEQLHVEGNIYASGTVTQSSDQHLKKDFSPISNALEKILSFNGLSYRWKDETKGRRRQLGFKAQEVEKVFPEVVVTDKNGFKAIAYQNLIAPVVEALREINLSLIAQESRISKLENENVKLRSALCQLSSELAICEKSGVNEEE